MIGIKKQQITEELQHIEDRIKRNFENRVAKPDTNDNEEPEAQELEEHFEDVLAESRFAIANANKKSKELEEKENHSQEESVIDVPSESSVVENNIESNNSETIDNNSETIDNNSEKIDECQEDKTTSEIKNKTLQYCENINEKNEVEEKGTNDELTNL